MLLQGMVKQSLCYTIDPAYLQKQASNCSLQKNPGREKERRIRDAIIVAALVASEKPRKLFYVEACAVTATQLTASGKIVFAVPCR
jgi:hypothetical protein